MARKRPSGTLVLNNIASTEGSFQPVVDLRTGGQGGYINDFRSFISNSSYVRRHVIPILLEYPRGFDYLDQPEVWKGILKALVEEHAKSIEGLNGSISMSFVETPFGASGEMQEDFSQVTRARSQVTFTWVEKQGRPIQEFLNYWIYYLFAHPDTQTPMIGSLPQNKDKYFDFLPDFNTMSMIFIEPDPFMKRVSEAWLIVNMAPKGSGDLQGSRNISDAMQQRELSIEFTGMQMMSNGVRMFAQSLLDRLSFTGLDAQNRRSSIETTIADLDEVKDGLGQNIGFIDQVNTLASTENVANLNGSIAGQRVAHNPDWVLSANNG